MIGHSCRFVLVTLCLASGSSSVQADGNWPGWRGPEGNGHSPDTQVPVRWNGKSVVWKTALPGSGQSSPVVWGDRIFLTAALEKGKKRIVLCLDRLKGRSSGNTKPGPAILNPATP